MPSIASEEINLDALSLEVVLSNFEVVGEILDLLGGLKPAAPFDLAEQRGVHTGELSDFTQCLLPLFFQDAQLGPNYPGAIRFHQKNSTRPDRLCQQCKDRWNQPSTFSLSKLDQSFRSSYVVHEGRSTPPGFSGV